jgi:hypothetical protein
MAAPRRGPVDPETQRWSGMVAPRGPLRLPGAAGGCLETDARGARRGIGARRSRRGAPRLGRRPPGEIGAARHFGPVRPDPEPPLSGPTPDPDGSGDRRLDGPGPDPLPPRRRPRPLLHLLHAAQGARRRSAPRGASRGGVRRLPGRRAGAPPISATLSGGPGAMVVPRGGAQPRAVGRPGARRPSRAAVLEVLGAAGFPPQARGVTRVPGGGAGRAAARTISARAGPMIEASYRSRT